MWKSVFLYVFAKSLVMFLICSLIFIASSFFPAATLSTNFIANLCISSSILDLFFIAISDKVLSGVKGFKALWGPSIVKCKLSTELVPPKRGAFTWSKP